MLVSRIVGTSTSGKEAIVAKAKASMDRWLKIFPDIEPGSNGLVWLSTGEVGCVYLPKNLSVDNVESLFLVHNRRAFEGGRVYPIIARKSLDELFAEVPKWLKRYERWRKESLAGFDETGAGRVAPILSALWGGLCDGQSGKSVRIKPSAVNGVRGAELHCEFKEAIVRFVLEEGSVAAFASVKGSRAKAEGDVQGAMVARGDWTAQVVSIAAICAGWTTAMNIGEEL